MSVTFSASPEPTIVGVKINCWDFSSTQIETSLETYQSDLEKHNAVCVECQAYQGALVEFDRVVNELNISNTNASFILENLGLSDKMFGNLSADEFLGRALLADALVPDDPGRPTISEGNFIQGGRDPLYLQNKIAHLIELCNWATAHNAEITWG